MAKAIKTMEQFGYHYNETTSTPENIRFDFSAAGFTTFTSWQEVADFIDGLLFFG